MGKSINKVVYGDQVLIDLTADSIAAGDLRKGITAHGASGPITGTAVMTYNPQTEELKMPGWMVETDG